MYYFVPRLPTAQAYKARSFRDAPNLKAIVEQLKEKPSHMYFTLRGQVLLSDADQPLENLAKYQFSGIRDLERLLESLSWDPNRMTDIYLYDHGSFKITCRKA